MVKPKVDLMDDTATGRTEEEIEHEIDEVESRVASCDAQVLERVKVLMTELT